MKQDQESRTSLGPTIGCTPYYRSLTPEVDLFLGSSDCLYFAYTATYCIVLSKLQKVFEHTVALRIVSNFLMQATRATFLALSSFNKRWRKAVHFPNSELLRKASRWRIGVLSLLSKAYLYYGDVTRINKAIIGLCRRRLDK
jgi:hypothetical protein